MDRESSARNQTLLYHRNRSSPEELKEAVRQLDLSFNMTNDLVGVFHNIEDMRDLCESLQDKQHPAIRRNMHRGKEISISGIHGG